MYGGLELGLAVFLAYCARRPERVRLGLIGAGCAVAGFGVTRLVALLVSGPVKPILLPLAVLELLGATIVFWAARASAVSAPNPNRELA